MRAITLGDIINGAADEAGAPAPSRFAAHRRREKVKMADNVNSPSHYTQGKVECIDAIEAACSGLSGFEGYCTGAAVKYLWRWKHKGGTEDLRKAAWYINRLIEAEVPK